MPQALRHCVSSTRVASVFAWSATFIVLAAVLFLVVRACGYSVQPVLSYGAYFFFQVYLPGLVALYFVNRGPVSLTTSVALGIPTGFAIEIFSFLAVAAADGKEGWRAVPVVWVAIAALIYTRRGKGLLRLHLTWRHAGLALALALLFLAAVVASTSHMYAESPLVAGLPQRPIFHDWVFLVSRASAIKNLWPLEDPSLAGVQLQYHYFMLVHVAAAATGAGLELMQVMLRMAILPLGLVLVVQIYALGRAVSRSAWGGVLAALLTVVASELGFQPQANESVFLGRFVRWLHVSPTFYFGMIYFGALLLVLARWRQLPRGDWRHLAWLSLLLAAAAGAKGTVVPVILVALALWFAWEWPATRRFPWRLTVVGLWGGAVFAAVYFTIMASWGTGSAKIVPGDVFLVSDFWKQNHAGWTAALSGWLPGGAAAAVAGIGCGAVILAGTLGVRVLALPYLLAKHPPAQRPLVAWLGAATLSSGGMGMLLKLDADSELYVFLLIRVPTAVLAAAALLELTRGLVAWINSRGAWPASQTTTGNAIPLWRRVTFGLLAVPVLAALTFQVVTAVRRMIPGLRDWQINARYQVVDEEIRRLQEALLWVREHTERDALLVANAFTPASMKKDEWGALDGTLMGVHYYYSALSERRLLVEGPYYALHPDKVTKRMEQAADVFYRRAAVGAENFSGGDVYLLLDRAAPGGAELKLPEMQRVFANSRVEIFQLPRTTPALTTAYSR